MGKSLAFFLVSIDLSRLFKATECFGVFFKQEHRNVSLFSSARRIRM